ncbi:MAG: LuxR family transcriptional regulator [Bordetella sp.]|nr:LuxR family transcriptional regulator [Bordetella sp.]
MTSLVERLTERERQCLRLVHAHFNSKQIARQLGIKPGTVDRHCENAVRKLQVDSRVAAALVLASESRPGIGNASQDGSAPMVESHPLALDRAAERAPDDRSPGNDAAAEMARVGSRVPRAGSDRSEEADGPSSGRGDPQTSGLPHPDRRHDGGGLHRRGDAGRQLLSLGDGSGRLGSLLVVFGVAAAAAWILTAAAGAQRFAFVLQHLRYGG